MRSLILCLIACALLSAGNQIKAGPIDDAKSARQFAAKQQYDRALEENLKALQVMQNNAEQYGSTLAYVLDDRARFLFESGDSEQAWQFAEQANQQSESSQLPAEGRAQISNTRATIAMALGQFEIAALEFKRGLDLTPAKQWRRSALTRSNLIGLYLETGQLLEAEALAEANLNELESRNADSLLAEALIQRAKIAIENSEAPNAWFERAKELPLNKSSKFLLHLSEAQYQIRQSKLLDAERQLSSLLTETSTALEKARVHYSLGNLYVLQGKIPEAQSQYQFALPLFRSQLSPSHPAIARSLHGLAITHKNLGQFAKSQHYYEQAIETFSQAFGEDHSSVAASRLEFSLLLSHIGLIEQAQRESLSAIESLQGEETLALGYAHSSLGFAYFSAQQYTDAQSSFHKAIQLIIKNRGEQSADLPPGLIKLAEIYLAQEKLDQAEQEIDRAIALLRSMGADTPYGLIKALSVKADIQKAQKKPLSAYRSSQEYIALFNQRLRTNQHRMLNLSLEEQLQVRGLFTEAIDTAVSIYEPAEKIGAWQRFIQWCKRLINAIFGTEYAASSMVDQNEIFDAIFQTAQYPHMHSTSMAIQSMSQRLNIEDETVANLLRRRQELHALWSTSHAKDIDVSAGLDEENQNTSENTDSLSAKISAIDEQLDEQYPQLQALINPKIVSIEQAKTLLADNELLILQLSEAFGSTLLFIRKDQTRVIRSALNSVELDAHVRKIRHSLDLTREDISYYDMPDFPHAQAYAIYQAFLEPAQDLIEKSEHIVFIQDGALQNLPPSVLLMAPYKAEQGLTLDYRAMKFFGHEKAISVVPSVSAFSALRAHQNTRSRAADFLGVGDPDLDLPSNTTRGAEFSIDNLAQEIFELGNPDVLRSMFVSLPETRHEIAELALYFPSNQQSLLFREQASERSIKSLDLKRYSTLGFATHAVLAGEFQGLMEPALVLTPPQKLNEEDNGLLMASEVANLRLDADWVILSACNTAGPSGRAGAEGLSGLAKSFFYAGARSLLVSHWWVDSDAAAALSTDTMRIFNENEVSKAEALRQAMHALAFDSYDYNAHPAFWAPFVMVGG